MSSRIHKCIITSTVQGGKQNIQEAMTTAAAALTLPLCKTITIETLLKLQPKYSCLRTKSLTFVTGLDPVLAVAFQEKFLRDRTNIN